MNHHYLAACGVAALVCMASQPAQAQDTVRRELHLPQQALSLSLRAVARAFGRNVSAASQVVSGRAAPAIEGAVSFEEALSALLAGSGLEAAPVGNGVVIRESGAGANGANEITVTGTRIRGADVASMTVAMTREGMRNVGQSSVAEAMRAIPQNFGGGQNPGIGANVPQGRGADLGGGASINLRGLGSDATLTLLDGRRMSYDAALQSVDVSAIPFGAIERIEIVPDGASALFGSDAVAGVANIILRRGFDGLETSAHLAASSDGGNFQQQYGAALGQVWSGGSAMLAYEFARTTPITAAQRSYAREDVPGVTLYPYLRHHNGALTLRHEVVPGLRFDFAGLYNTRWRRQTLPLNPAGDLSASRFDSRQRAQSWAGAPSLTLSLPADWEATLAGSFGWNKVAYGGAYVFGSSAVDAGSGRYRNVTGNVEVSGSGNLVDLPSGTARLALGAGYRRNLFKRVSTQGIVNAVDEAQASYYAFAELNLPLVGPGEASPLGERLEFSLAARHEHYPGLASVTTPKLGMIYAPSPDVTFKASWGRSFRAATLYEQFTPATAYLVNASSLGGTASAGATAILVQGGNPDLDPERSTNWSATLALHPRGLGGAELEISYFDIRYRDRIVTPIPYTNAALSDPLYAERLTRDPAPEAQSAVIDHAVQFTNITGSPYDPARVVAIVDNTNVNAGRQTARGIDVLAKFSFALAGGTLASSLNASYIDSKQRIGPGQPVTALAGRIFNPPHWRARGELSWKRGALTLTGAANYIGPVRDTRQALPARIAGMMPVDFTLRYRTDPGGGLLGGLDLIAAVQNLFNDKPSPIATTLYIDTPYDSTNYSPFGRVFSVTVAKTW